MGGVEKDFLQIGIFIFSLSFLFSSARGASLGFKVGAIFSILTILFVGANIGGFILFVAPLVALATALPITLGVIIGSIIYKFRPKSKVSNVCPKNES